MGEVKVEEEVEAEVDTIWNIVRDFGGLKKWSAGLESCEVEGSGIGAVRTIKMGPIEIKERLEKLDEAKRSFSYAIVGGPVPVENYLSTMTISEAGPKRARITWSATFTAKGAPEADCVKLFEGVYKGGIAGLRKAVAS